MIYLEIRDLEKYLSPLDPFDRWDLFLEPLIAALSTEGIGEVLDVENLVQVAEGRKFVASNEITLEVSALSKGSELIERIRTAAQSTKSS